MGDTYGDYAVFESVGDKLSMKKRKAISLLAFLPLII